MTCEHADIFAAPETLPTCPICAHMADLDRQGRALADLLDSGTVDPVLRAAILGAKSSAGWSAEVREIVAQCR